TVSAERLRFAGRGITCETRSCRGSIPTRLNPTCGSHPRRLRLAELKENPVERALRVRKPQFGTSRTDRPIPSQSNSSRESRVVCWPEGTFEWCSRNLLFHSKPPYCPTEFGPVWSILIVRSGR